MHEPQVVEPVFGSFIGVVVGCFSSSPTQLALEIRNREVQHLFACLSLGPAGA